MPTENVSTIGSDVSRDYANLVDWKNDFGTGLPSDITAAGSDTIEVAEVHNDNGAGVAALTGNPLINPAVTVDSTNYLVIRAAAGQEFVPGDPSSLTNHSGVFFTHTTGVMRVSTQFTRVQHIGFISLHTGSGFLRCLRFNSTDGFVDSCYFQMLTGTNDFLIGLSNESGGAITVTNCIARGSNTGTTGGVGMRIGYYSPLGAASFDNCGAWGVKKRLETVSPFSTLGIGFNVLGATSSLRNCWALECGSDAGVGNEGGFVGIDASATFENCASTDGTANASTDGQGGMDSVDYLDDGVNLYALKPGSEGVNAGIDLSGSWPYATIEDFFNADHDDDGGGWDIGPFNASISIVPDGIASEESFGTASLEVHVSPTGIPTAEAFGTAAVNSGIVSVTTTGIASAEVFGTAALTASVDLEPNGIATAEAFGTAAIVAGAVNVTPGGIATAEAFGAVVVSAGTALVSPPSIASAEAFGAAVLAPGAVTISPSSIASAEAFGSPALVPIAVVISPGGIAPAEAFGTATVSSGAIIVQPGGIASAEAFGSAVLTAGASSLLPSGIASVEAFGTAALQSTVDVLVSSIAPSELWGTPTAVPSIETVSPSGIASAEAFGSPALTLLVALVSPASIASEEIWGQAQLLIIGQSRDVSPAGILSGERWGHPFLTGGVIPVTLKELIQNALIDAGKQGTFLDANYDPDLCTLSSGLQRTPSSIEANEVSSVFKTESRHGRKVLQDRSQWQWLLILQFEEEVILQPFEDQLLENPLCIERDIAAGVTRQVTLKLLDVSPKHPPRQGASNGTQARYRFSAELSSL
jgi:hypothetical protein